MDHTDAVARRHARHRRWANGTHPLLREIGEQLERGKVRPADLLAVPEYRELIQSGLAKLRQQGARIAEERARRGGAA